MRRRSQLKKATFYNKKTKIKFDTKDNTMFEDNSGLNSKFKIIFDEKEPFYKHTQEREK